ncbi:MAG: Crp/Fnr family transcriptional regulator [Hominenteromicrobium sp.]
MNAASLPRTPLFRDIRPDEAERLLHCLNAFQRRYEKNGVILRMGSTAPAIGIVLSGSATVESCDVWGNRSVLDRVGPGAVFAETYACLPGEPMMVSVVAAEPTEILFLRAAKLLSPCASACGCHAQLIRNLLAVSAQKNLTLSRRIFHTSAKTIRERVLSYLSFQAIREKSDSFSIPFNRQQLADYLGVDRSALSKELSKMRADGLIDFHKNRFVLNTRKNHL